MATTSTMWASAAITNRDYRAVLDAVKVLASLDPWRGFDLDRICAQRQICHYVMAAKDWRDGCSARLVVGRQTSAGTREVMRWGSYNGGSVLAKDGEPGITLTALQTRRARAFSSKDPARNR